MPVKTTLIAAARRAIQAPRRLAGAALLVLIVSALAATQLGSGSPERLLARSHSAVGAATIAQERSFGGEPVVVDLAGDLDNTLSAGNLAALLRLEDGIRRLGGVRTVMGPATFISQAVNQMNRVVFEELGPAAERADVIARRAVARARADGLSADKLAAVDKAARLRALGPLRAQYEELFVRFGYIGIPSLSNRSFVLQLVKGAGVEPKPRFAWLFPDGQHALVIVRLRSGLSDTRVRELGAQLTKLVGGAGLSGIRPLVAGPPLVLARATSTVSNELLRLLPVVIVAMLLVLLLALGVRSGAAHLMLPAGLAVVATAGLSWPLGLGYTAATLAALPVVLGLALDYAVQLQTGYWAQRHAGVAPREAAIASLERLGPTLLLAGGAMIAGFLMLLISPVPLVNRLGVTLAVGVFCALGCVLGLGPALMVARDRAGTQSPRLLLPQFLVRPALRTAALSVATGVTLAGLVLSGGTQVESDLRKLANPKMPELQRLESLQRELGTSGQLRVAITASDVTTPRALDWMSSVEPRLLALDPGLRPGPNLAAILSSGGSAQLPDAASVTRLLRLIPPGFTSAVLTPDHRRAEISFGVPLGSAAQQARLIERMQHVLEGAPPGVHAQVAGLLASSAAGVTGLQDERPWLLLLAALVIFVLLYAARRSLERALIPLLPALLAAGTTGVIVAAAGVRLSPLSAGLDPLVLAVGVEFGLLLEARYREERSAGLSPESAARVAVERVGASVAVAAGTVALGFGVLALSRLTVLRQFGLLAALELLLSVLAAIVLVPALAAAAERRSADRGLHAHRRRPLATTHNL
jgi:hydrophobe/amphiphile efflux-3 (HAE3) family protein